MDVPAIETFIEKITMKFQQPHSKLDSLRNSVGLFNFIMDIFDMNTRMFVTYT